MRRAASVEGVGELGVPLDARVKLVGRERAAHPRGVEPEVAPDGSEVVVLERRVPREDRVVRGPEALHVAPLLAGDLGQLGGGLGARVKRQRLVPPHESHVVSVRLEHPLQRPLDALAEGALKVRELDDGHQRRGGPARRRVADRHPPHRHVLVVGLALGRRRRGALVLLRQLDVDPIRARPGRPRGGSRGKLRVDDLAEAVEGLRPRELHSIEEEDGSAVRADLLGEGHVLVDLGNERVRVEPGAVARQIAHAGLLGPLQVAVGAEALLVLQRCVVEPPEGLDASKLEDPLRGLGGGLGVGVKRERLVLPDDAHLGRAIRPLDLLERRLDPRAEWALKIAEHHDRDGRRALAPRRVVRIDGHGGVGVRPGRRSAPLRRRSDGSAPRRNRRRVGARGALRGDGRRPRTGTGGEQEEKRERDAVAAHGWARR